VHSVFAFLALARPLMRVAMHTANYEQGTHGTWSNNAGPGAGLLWGARAFGSGVRDLTSQGRVGSLIGAI